MWYQLVEPANSFNIINLTGTNSQGAEDVCLWVWRAWAANIAVGHPWDVFRAYSGQGNAHLQLFARHMLYKHPMYILWIYAANKVGFPKSSVYMLYYL